MQLSHFLGLSNNIIFVLTSNIETVKDCNNNSIKMPRKYTKKMTTFKNQAQLKLDSNDRVIFILLFILLSERFIISAKKKRQQLESATNMHLLNCKLLQSARTANHCTIMAMTMKIMTTLLNVESAGMVVMTLILLLVKDHLVRYCLSCILLFQSVGIDFEQLISYPQNRITSSKWDLLRSAL